MTALPPFSKASLLASVALSFSLMACGSSAPEFDPTSQAGGGSPATDTGTGLADGGSGTGGAQDAGMGGDDVDTMGTWVDTGAVVSENTNKLCSDGKDNDNDGKIDCEDLSCKTGVGVTVCDEGASEADNTTCSDGLDNDGDGKTDCVDDDCNNNFAVTVCKSGSEESNADCDDGVDNDGDGKTDCADSDCSKNPTVTVCDSTGAEKSNGACSDGKDNDNDGYTDCDDFDCSKNAAVTVCGQAKVENTNALCSDGKDNDDNGYTDCDDFGCSKNDLVTVCKGGSKCGDGKCDPGESSTSCPADCKPATKDSCKGRCGDTYDSAYTCQCDSQCQTFDDCCDDYAAQCLGGGPKCGDGKCEGGETTTTCPADCKPSGPTCGDGKCESGESNATCPADCKSSVCKGGCDDKNPCTIDSCDEAKKVCLNKPAKAGTKCADGNSCKAISTCDSAGVCQAGKTKPDGASCPGGGTCKAGTCSGATAVPPDVGDLVFTELMIHSQAGADPGEWIEVTNVSKKSLNLSKLTLAKGAQSVTFPPAVAKAMPPGARFVIGATKDATKNHGAPVDIAQTKIKLGNGGSTLTLRLGQKVIDEFTYGAKAAKLGVAIQLSADKLNAKANDNALSWCFATAAYGTAGKLGTPGKANSVCAP